MSEEKKLNPYKETLVELYKDQWGAEVVCVNDKIVNGNCHGIMKFVGAKIIDFKTYFPEVSEALEDYERLKKLLEVLKKYICFDEYEKGNDEITMRICECDCKEDYDLIKGFVNEE